MLARCVTHPVLVCAIAWSAAPAQAIDFQWAGGSGAWENPASWLPRGVPGPADTARLGAGVITISTAQSVGALWLEGARMFPSADLWVGGVLQFTAGQLGGFGGEVVAAGGLVISGAFDKRLGDPNGVVPSGLTSLGVGLWTGGNVSNAGAGRFTNAATASFDIQGDAVFSGGTFVNQGSLRKSVGAADLRTSIQASFSNSGSVGVDAGTLRLGDGGVHRGSFSTAPGAWLELGTLSSSTVHDFLGPAAGLPAATVRGNVRFIASNLIAFRAGAGYDAQQTELLPFARVAFEDTAVAARTVTLAIAGGASYSAGDLIVSGLTRFTAGQVGGFGGEVIAAGGLVVSGAADKRLGDPNGVVPSGLTNRAAGLWSGGNFSNAGAGRFTNADTGVFDIQSDGLFSGGSFINQGTLKKTVGAADQRTVFNATFVNNGIVAVEAGTLRLSGGGVQTGSFTTAADAWLELSAPPNQVHDFLGGVGGRPGAGIGGNVRFIASNQYAYFRAGTHYDALRTEVTASARVVFEDTATPARTGTLLVSGGTMAGSGHLVASGLTSFTGGQLGGFGGEVVAAGGLSVSGPAGKRLGDPNGVVPSGLTNLASGSWSGGDFSNAGGGRLTNAGTGVFDIQSDASFTGGILVNEGLLRKTAGAADGQTRVTGAFSNTGTVQVLQGTLQVASAFTNAGRLTVAAGATFHGSNTGFANTGRVDGQGTVRTATNGALFNQGVVAPGLEIGTLTIDGDLVMGTAGIVEIELGALGSADRLEATDDVTLNGMLQVLNLGATPAIGDSFVVLAFDQRLADSRFAVLSWSGFAPDIGFALSYNLHDVTLRVVAVPEPDGRLLLLAGAAGIAALRRRHLSPGPAPAQDQAGRG